MIIRSILENDLYKFSMSYYYQDTRPYGIGTNLTCDIPGVKASGTEKDIENYKYQLGIG